MGSSTKRGGRRRCAALALLLPTLLACGRGADDRAGIPLPADAAELDARVRARIDGAASELRSDPTSVERWSELAMTYEGNDLFGLAIECYDRALGLAPSAKLWHRRACSEAGRGDWEAAARDMRRSLELDPDYAPSQARLGSYLFDLGAFDEAEAAFRAAERLDPDYVGGPLGEARVALQRGAATQAIALLEGILSRKPDEPATLRLLRTALLQAGRADEAARLNAPWRKRASLGKDPWLREFREHRERPQMEQALDLLQSGDAARAVELLEEFVAEKPDDLNAVAYLAQGYALTNRTDVAFRALEEGLGHEPNNLLLLRVLAKVQEDAGRPEDALATLQHVIEVDPSDFDAWRKKSRLERNAGRSEAALDSLERALALDRREPELFADAGTLALALGRIEQAIASFEEARRARVQEPELTLGLARAYSLAGRTDEAIALLEGAHDLGDAGARLLEELRAAREKPRG